MASLKELQDLYAKNNLGKFTLYKDEGNTWLRIPEFEGSSGTISGYVLKNPDLSGLDKSLIEDKGALNWTAGGGISQTHADESWQRAAGRAQGKSLESIISNLSTNIDAKVKYDKLKTAEKELNQIIDQHRGGSGNYDFDPELLKRAQQGNVGIRNGAFVNLDSWNRDQAIKNDPNMINIGTKERPMYIPKGSPAEAQQKGISQEDYLKSAEGKDYLAKNPDITPVTPTQPTQHIMPVLPTQPTQQAGGVSAAGTGQAPMEYYNERTGQTINLKNYPNMDDADLRSQGWKPKSESAPTGQGGQYNILPMPQDQTGQAQAPMLYKNAQGQEIDPRKFAKFNTDAEYDQWARSQGFRPVSESAPVAPSKPLEPGQFGILGENQQKYGDILTLPNGQKISPQDPNYTTYAKQLGIQEGQTGQTGMTTGETGTNDAMRQLLEKLIASDPFLAEQLSDPEMRKMFDTLPPELQGAYLSTLKSLGTRIEAGEIINPDIEIDPEKTKEFLADAMTELDPYFQEQIGLIKGDLETSFARLQEDFNKGIRRAEEPFKMNLQAQAQSEAEAGTAYSSGRVKREQMAIGEQQNILDDYFTQAQRSIEDAGSAAERQVGSENMRSLNIPQLSGYSASAGGFTPTNGRTLFTPQGNLIGSIPKQRTVDISQRVSQQEEAYRKQRVLDLSKL